MAAAVAVVRPHRLPSLTGMRFAAAASVFAFHASFAGVFADAGTQHRLAQVLAKAGWVGVSFFFVLSGFVLTWSARPAERAHRFWRRRLAKIYPSHLVTALAAFVLLAATAAAPGPGAVAVNVTLLQSFFPQPHLYVSGNPVSWSLSCELLFYLAFPLLWRALRALPARALVPVAAGLAAVVTALPAAVALLPATPALVLPDGTTGQWQYWLLYVFPPVRAAEFALGMVVARIVREGRWRGPRPLPAALLLGAGYVLATQLPYLAGLVAATVVPIALLIGALAHADATGRPTPLAGPVWVRLGELSFALYLVHRLVLIHGHQALGRRAFSTPAALLVLAAAFTVSLLLAALLYHAVEKPAMRLLAVSAKHRENTPAIPAEIRRLGQLAGMKRHSLPAPEGLRMLKPLPGQRRPPKGVDDERPRRP
ncbi:Acyltransferase family protein [Streptomyces sp. YIM 121038]|uniref:acyltransferase family protein n=1 Tax=Streptomyces sp. YIM 121038 TaxID=2136401 RepID=UPI0011107662|nr:acyltransferase [Streptomyces sp. YIM 121038]QCX73794.1 Acyltransferase family protein [Streptomyces sp. YIM 121038]QCX82025.1 Acyltransferase family protein [Streptomyces sp. YIM 121038]